MEKERFESLVLDEQAHAVGSLGSAQTLQKSTVVNSTETS